MDGNIFVLLKARTVLPAVDSDFAECLGTFRIAGGTTGVGFLRRSIVYSVFGEVFKRIERKKCVI